jgi:TonB family protein
VNAGVVNQILPDVPPKARNTIRGTVVANIRVTVEPDGEVSDAAIESGGSKYFSDLALRAARQWSFKPLQADGQAVSRVLLLHFEFTQTATRANLVR